MYETKYASGKLKVQIKDYLNNILMPITGDNDAPIIQVTQQDKFLIINIIVDEQNVGRVIGKQGVIIKAIQSLLVAGFIKGRYQLLIDVTGRKEKTAVT